MPWVRRASIARLKLQSQFKAYLAMQTNLLTQHGASILHRFPIQCVELTLDSGLMEEMQRLRTGVTTDVIIATIATQNPCGIDVVFGDTWIAHSLEDHRARPSLMLMGPSNRPLGAACVQLATSFKCVLSSHRLCSSVDSGTWTCRTAPRGHWHRGAAFIHHVPHTRQIHMTSTQMHTFTPMDIASLQVPSAKAALLAPLLCSDTVNQGKDILVDPEFLIRSFLPLIIDSSTLDWTKTCQAISEQITVGHFDAPRRHSWGCLPYCLSLVPDMYTPVQVLEEDL